jgi:multidrug transporter EmrE-like cation transporter
MDKRHCYTYLVLINLYYSFISVATKLTSRQRLLSSRYFLGLGIVIALLVIYAILWQRILKKVYLSDAFMFKGMSIIFILLISHFVFNESVFVCNIIGSILIIYGIILFVHA